MTSIVAVYRGDSESRLELVAASGDPDVVADVTARMLGASSPKEDPVLQLLESGRRQALRLTNTEAKGRPKLSLVPMA